MRKGLSLSIVAGVVLALVGVTVLIGTYSNTVGKTFQNSFCMLYNSISFAFPGNSPPPAGCGETSSIDYTAVEESSKEKLEVKLVASILNCWQRYEGYRTEEEVCEGWNVKNLEGEITESDVTEIIRDGDYCPGVISNNQSVPNSCGDADNIRFRQNISKNSFIIIRYHYNETENWEGIEVR